MDKWTDLGAEERNTGMGFVAGEGRREGRTDL